ncbi:uncharacterized protein K441DRAFT_648073 [Cenococcum geophilum 1.58]|uniref:Uncharacterized protein n=1 Tax=Cenococcum geophilum 1.58 TaxID=794803 RepID=A0ACC8ENE0_9PEZI|nr:hypothetical protein K441DRAFT_648073 [Cenococcum geophilum 1.58]
MSLQSSTTCWGRLPPELRMIALEMLVEPNSEQSTSPWRKHNQSAYAAVCREWQYFFERTNFQRLTIHQSDLLELGRIVQGQRRMFVKWIWLRLELPEYDCKCCNKQESSKEIRSHNFVFTNALWDLFAILSTWEKKGEFGVGERGPTLELSAHSPSDSKHFRTKLDSRINDTAWSRSRGGPKKRHHDCAHGWKKGRQTRWSRDDAKMRVFGHPGGLKFDLRAPSARKMRTLPKVRVIKSLVIRRQFYRAFSVAKALQPIIQCLTQLENFIYEPWRGIDTKGHSGRAIRDMEHHLLFLDVFKYRRSLRRVSIFEDFNYVFHWRRERRRYTLLGEDLARSSRNFEELHASLNVDAKDFFHAFWPGQDPKAKKGLEWKNLKYLSLTSHWLNPWDCDQLVRTAAAAAQRMPQLEIMELWNGGEGHLCIFRYERQVNRPRIQLVSTWGGQLGAQARACWRVVAREHELQAEPFYLDASLIKSHVSVLHYLVLKRRLLSEISLQQMQTEAKR